MDLHLQQERDCLQKELLEWMAHWRGSHSQDPARFEALALRIFAWQVQTIPAYQAFVRSQQVDPASVLHWHDIPLVPVSAFKFAELATHRAMEQSAAVFETSGTSDGQPGRVHLADTSLYNASLQATFRHFVLPDVDAGQEPAPLFRCLSLVPREQDKPHSSLGFMVRRLTAHWDDGGGSEHLLPGKTHDDLPGLALDGLVLALQTATQERVPALIFATSLALEVVLRQWPKDLFLQLPAGSRLMDTGGPKGRVLTADRSAQHAFLQQHWGLPAEYLVGELGMTELCSQRYETALLDLAEGRQPGPNQTLAAPPWLRSIIREPGTQRLCQPGEIGMVGHLDLANLDTCAFVLTADLGQLDAAGHLQLHGRVPGSEWRGCGLDAEALLGLQT